MWPAQGAKAVRGPEPVKRDPGIIDLLDHNPRTMDTVIEVIIGSFHTYFTFSCRSSVTSTSPTGSA